jgi:hypothetical protein
MTVGKFYTIRIRPASYYVNRYCFEMEPARIKQAIAWLLPKYHFPVDTIDHAKGLYKTKAVHMPRLSRNPEWGYTVALVIKVESSKGKINLGKVPSWAIEGKQPSMPPPPQRSQFPTAEAYYKAQNEHIKKQTQLLEQSAMGYKVMKKWEGCKLKTSTNRTIVSVKSILHAYPLTRFDTLDRKKGCQTSSDRSLEHAIIRVLAWRIKKLKFVPEMLYDKRPRMFRGNICRPRKPKPNYTPSKRR